VKVFSDKFHAALEHVLRQEGGWSDHPKDPGGATYKGITLKLYREFKRNPAITKEQLRRITAEDVYAIYHDLYWRNIRGDELPAGVDLEIFDAAVNSGVKTAGLMLQRAIGQFSPFDIKKDGVIGSQTIAAARGIVPERLLDEIGARRIVYYGLLRTFVTFGLGWARRKTSIGRAAYALVVAGRLAASFLSTEEGKSNV
jgi:lysozyme family protein